MATFPTTMAVAAFPTTRLLQRRPPLLPLPRALAHLCGARLRRWSHAYRPPLPSSSAPTSSMSPHPAAGDHEGIADSRPCSTSRSHRGSACLGVPSERSSRQPSLWCSSLRHLPAPILPIEAVIEFLNAPNMVPTSH
jgi:hypothetical protein